MKIEKILKSFLMLVITASIIFTSSFYSIAAQTYTLHNSVKTYKTADEAKNKTNPAGTYPAGEYFVFREYTNGMINISKAPNQAGAWINPSDNIDQPSNVETDKIPEISATDFEKISSEYAAGIFTLNSETKTYKTFEDALAEANSNGKLVSGKYYIYESRDGMLNISNVNGQMGQWINPGEAMVDVIKYLERIQIESPELRIESELRGTTYYSVFGTIKGYSTSQDALRKINSVKTVEPGTYYIYKHADNMLNVTTDISQPGTWINPRENNTMIRIRPEANPTEYVNKVGPVAQKLTSNKDLYASVMIAQSMLESGFGTSHLSSEKFNNYFGIKGYFKEQAVAIHTFEYTSKGESYSVIAPFKKYNSIDESFADYIDFLTGSNNPESWRYKLYYGVRKSQAKTYKDAANYLTGRYATSPEYGTVLIKLIDQYDLTRFDTYNGGREPEEQSGWKKIGDKWSYIDESGKQVISSWKRVQLLDSNNMPTGDYNWKYFNAKGESIDQFYKENGLVWLSKEGPYNPYHKGWWTDPNSGYKYFFRLTSGTRVSGRQYVDGGWIYFRETGSLALGWQYYQGAWRYNDPANNGKEVTGTWKWLPIKDKEGVKNWKFFNSKGESMDQSYRENGYVWLSQKGPATEYRRGWWYNPQNKSKYFFRLKTGSMVTGKQYIDGNWRYFRSSGTLATGWQYINGHWNYYISETGAMVTGRKVIDGKTYTFTKDGNLIGRK
ncbi:glucosaminidase domain-containing protein [Helcococcus kunzii]|uniref:glucosaminidase domain-containing protein n=1 Tax=Helcococcus kunzii TaxID=40091 RepID=UPI0021A4CD29|nr:glucosaminidase domain-containing protein [Helcococcus kunzii]MCT1796061.1 glucosaminidase domain-containing protein [Helcococcus kunzii]MCT1989756.1 glucosaminidase domain-containing protein [Helcococcus kunzii]